MTEKKFFELLAKTPRAWTVQSDYLRCADMDCPITAVYRAVTKRRLLPSEYRRAARTLRLDISFATDVAWMSDYSAGTEEKLALRHRLIQACAAWPR